LSEIPRAGEKVATLTLQDLLEQIKHDSIEVKQSRTASDTLKRIWKNFAPLHSLYNPDLDEWVEVEFPSYATFAEALEALLQVESALNRGFLIHINAPGSGRLSDLRNDLFSLLLHRAVQSNWEFSATVHFDNTRYRIPLGLLENRHFKLDTDWHSGRFGCMHLFNLHVHRHDLHPSAAGYDFVDARLDQRLPHLLTNARLGAALKSELYGPSGNLEVVTKSYIERHHLLEFHPRAISSEVTGKVYAQPFQNGTEKRGPKSKAEVTRRIFLRIAGQHLDAETLDTVIGKINNIWIKEYSSESAPPKNPRTVREHLRKLGFWTEDGWDMSEILAAISKRDGTF
jgi:hypothetical protein